jgi:hypothetical protein
MKDLHTVDKYKARLCGCGNQLAGRPGYDQDTVSPTVSMLTHTCLLQLSIYDNMFMATYDTVAAYLYQTYPAQAKPLYLRLPRRVAQACNIPPDQTYRVKKYLYGLADAGRAYYLAYSKLLTEKGYTKSLSDPCLFYRLVPEQGIRTMVWFHVDDTFVASTHKEELDLYEQSVKSQFRITADYEVTKHLGITMTKLADGSIKLTQPKLLADIINEFPTDGTAKYPMKLTGRKPLTHYPPVDRTVYLSLLGKLMYLGHSRPDILTAISYAACHSTEPTTYDYDALLEIVSYLKGTASEGLTLRVRGDNSSDDLTLTCYVDASYLSHSDAGSHTGYCLSLGTSNSFFHSKSRKQKLTATSSTHAECRALYDLTLNVIYIANLLDEVGRPLKLPVRIYEDNQPIIDLATNEIGKVGNSKHFLMLVAFIREQVALGLISLKKIATRENISNVLTKAVVGAEFIASANKLLGNIGYQATTDTSQSQAT